MEIEQFKVERWLNAYELDARYNLAETDAKPFSLEELLSLGDKEALTQELMDLKLGYNPTTGSRALRSIIAGRYRGVDPGEVLVTVGAIEADCHIANVLVKPGDTVIVQFPAYQVLVAKARGATVKFWDLRMEEGYRPNLEALRCLIDRRTKLVVVNNPHNPTGAVLSQDDMRTILGWAQEEGFWVLSDEVYHGLAFEEGVVAEPARNLSHRAISVGSMSKTFGLSGLRLGWMAGPREILEACWAWKDYTSISNSPVSDFLARLALRESGRVWERNLKIARENLEVLEGWFDRMSRFVSYTKPRAGLVCFPKFTLPVGTEEFCLRAYHERGVLLVPGECFDVPGHIRFGFGGDPGTFSRGLEELGAVMSEIQD
ncbi:MAG: aminotransferase class I/II-fold pyridoxal phosphate-dependent enzyme [Bacillota bacterium]